MKRITKAALGGLAGCALVVGGPQVAMSAVDYFLYPKEGQTQLEDLSAVGPFDSASGNLRVKVSPTGTNFKLEVDGIAESATGKVYGAHLHTGWCDPHDASLAGPHYNREVHGVIPGKAFPKLGELPSETVAAVSYPATEVWFNFVPNAHGSAVSDATVLFVPVDADKKMSIVVHLLPTNTEDDYPNPGLVGSAGGRQACFPIDASEWALDPPKTP